MAGFQRTPCEAYIFNGSFYFTRACNLIFFLVYRYQRILFYPIQILAGPFLGIFFVFADSIRLSHGGEPFMPVKLPTKFIILNRPVLPVDIFAVVERRLVAIVYIERMFQCLIRPLLLTLADVQVVKVDGRVYNSFAMIIQQCLGCFIFFSRFMESFYLFQPGVIKVEQ